MSIDLSRVTGISDSRGVITEIKDSLGRVIWAVSGGKAVLMVEKITADTAAGETTYTGEQFIRLNIYPKTNGTVKVTYGGLTKTIKDESGAENPNAIPVFFGTFNGVSDSVETPASGELTIKGDYDAYGCCSYESTGKVTFSICSCITDVIEIGTISYIPPSAFYNCDKITKLEIPDNISQIGNAAFNSCDGLLSVTLLSTEPPALGNDIVFDGTTCTIIVPKGCGNAYKTAQYWSEYADRIVEAS